MKSSGRFTIFVLPWQGKQLAIRGKLTWSDQAVPLQIHLKLFEEIILGYIDLILAPKAEKENNQL